MGKPRGICRDCYNLQERDRRYKGSIAKNFYNARGALQSHNARALASLRAPGAYPLTYLNSGQNIGYIVLKLDSYLITLWHNQQNRYHIDQASTALYLSNQGLSIGSTSIDLTAPDGAILDPDTVGNTLPIEVVADKLIILDVKLKEYAVKKVREELEGFKEKRKTRPRSKNPGVSRMGKDARLVEKKKRV
jgi:hypothetical protein